MMMILMDDAVMFRNESCFPQIELRKILIYCDPYMAEMENCCELLGPKVKRYDSSHNCLLSFIACDNIYHIQYISQRKHLEDPPNSETENRTSIGCIVK